MLPGGLASRGRHSFQRRLFNRRGNNHTPIVANLVLCCPRWRRGSIVVIQERGGRWSRPHDGITDQSSLPLVEALWVAWHGHVDRLAELSGGLLRPRIWKSRPSENDWACHAVLSLQDTVRFQFRKRKKCSMRSFHHLSCSCLSTGGIHSPLTSVPLHHSVCTSFEP